MADDPEPDTAAETPSSILKATEEPERTIMGVPLGSFVRGGTRTMAHEHELHLHLEDTARRRAEADEDKRIATEEGGHLFTNNFASTPNAQRAYVVLEYLMPNHRETSHKCLADVVMTEGDNGPELSLIVICPKCVANGDPLDLCHMQIRQSNKHWELDLRGAGEPVEFDGQIYMSAGKVRDCPRSKCGNCGWAFKIDNNKVYPV